MRNTTFLGYPKKNRNCNGDFWWLQYHSRFVPGLRLWGCKILRAAKALNYGCLYILIYIYIYIYPAFHNKDSTIIPIVFGVLKVMQDVYHQQYWGLKNLRIVVGVRIPLKPRSCTLSPTPYPDLSPR